MKFSSTEFYESSAFLSHKLDITYVSCNSMMGEKKKEKNEKIQANSQTCCAVSDKQA